MERSANTNAYQKNPRLLYIAAGFASLGGFLFGYDSSVISGAILFIKKQFSLSSSMEEIIISSLFLSAMVGAPVGGVLADKVGRRKVLILTGVLFALGSFGVALSPTVTFLLISRFVMGVSLGMVSVTSPIYISELAHVSFRGWMVSFYALSITIGTLVSYMINLAFTRDSGWRWMFAIGAIPAIMLGIGMVFLPETPRWLLSHSFPEKARSVLKKIRGIINVDNEFDGIVKSIGQHSGNWSELLSPSVRPALILGFGLAFLRAFAGFSVILYGYAPTIFQFAGVESASDAILATVAVGIVNVIMTIVAMKFIDSWGRRPLLLIGLMGSVISLAVLGFAFMFPESGMLTGWLALGSLLLYIGSWSFGPRPVFWLLISEIYPLKIRGLGMSVGTLTNWGTICLVTLTFLTLTDVFGRPGTFWFYGLAGICTWLLVYFFVPETKGQSLESIEDHWRSGRHPREMGK